MLQQNLLLVPHPRFHRLSKFLYQNFFQLHDAAAENRPFSVNGNRSDRGTICMRGPSGAQSMVRCRLSAGISARPGRDLSPPMTNNQPGERWRHAIAAPRAGYYAPDGPAPLKNRRLAALRNYIAFRIYIKINRRSRSVFMARRARYKYSADGG